MKSKPLVYTKKLVLIAMLSAILTGGKLALAALPNVEVVTLLILLFSFTFGIGVAMPAVLIFCTTEWLIFGLGYWVLSYYIYWPAICLAACLLRRIWYSKIHNSDNQMLDDEKSVQKKEIPLYLLYTVLACVSSALFGVLTSAIDASIISNFSHSFFRLFAVIYTRGIAFYVTHTVSNTLVTAALFPPLSRAFSLLGKKYFN